MQSRRQTAWRKSRKFGDVYGGRVRPRVTDGIFERAHSLEPPAARERTPILIQENPSRELYFPLSAAELCPALEALPRRHVEGITHLWLRRRRVGRDYARHGAAVVARSGRWYVRFGEMELRHFYVQQLPFHEIGHHVDRFHRHWSKANAKQVEEFADQYAFQSTATAAHAVDLLQKQRASSGAGRRPDRGGLS